MYLKRLEIHGFKSFAQKTVMEFSQGIIAIVGPNGSGKSNVADSLRWVLGEQSAKIVRGKKADDVIFAGSDKKTRLGFAEVVATFDNRDRRIPVDTSEVSIGRRIDRSGESEYLINGNKVRLLDIVDLVLKSNIGTSRYTVIGQGTIDQMILQGPGEVKNLLDEASGVKTYYLKREKTLRRLEQTAQNLMRAEDLMAEIEPRLKSLRRQAKKMEARAEIEQELRVSQRMYFGRMHKSLAENVAGYAGKIQALEMERGEMEKVMQQFRSTAETAEKQNVSMGGKWNELEEKITSLQNEKNRLLENLSLVKGKMQSRKTAGSMDAESLQVGLHAATAKLTEVRGRIQASQTGQAAAQAEAVARRQALQQINSLLETLYENLRRPIEINWEAFDRQLGDLEQAFSRFYAVAETAGDVSLVKSAASALRQTFEKFSREAKNSVTQPHLGHASLQKEVQELLQKKEAVQEQIKQFELDLSKFALALDFARKEEAAAEQERLHLELELKKVQSGSEENFVASLAEEEARLQAQVDRLSEEVASLKAQAVQYEEENLNRQKQVAVAETEYRRKQDQVIALKDKISAIQIEKAKFDAQMEVLEEEIRRLLGHEVLVSIRDAGEQEEVGEATELEAKIARLKNQLDMIGGMDELTMKEYQETEVRYSGLSTQVEDLKRGMADLRSVMDELDEHIRVRFNEAFHKINEKFEHYFRVLFNGGRAYLGVIKADDAEAIEAALEAEAATGEGVEEQEKLRPEEKLVKKYEKGASAIIGVDIKATPPGKKLASIQALSGGERALTAIALLCSLLTCFPSPFVVLDEVDAALDDANTIRFGQILGTLSHQTQFVTITHNRETMAQANILYGVTMGDDGISKLLSVKLDQARQFAK